MKFNYYEESRDFAIHTNPSFEDILNRHIDSAIHEMKDGDRFSREKAQKKYQVLADIRSSVAREKFYQRHKNGK